MGISYRKLPSGAHRADVYAAGRRRSVSAPTRTEVQRLAAQVLLELGGQPDRRTVAVGTVLDAHLAAGAADWSPQYATDLRYLAANLPADFLALPAATLSQADVAALYRRLPTDAAAVVTWSPHRLQRLHGLLSGAFRRAVVAGWVPGNPCTDVGTAVHTSNITAGHHPLNSFAIDCSYTIDLME